MENTPGKMNLKAAHVLAGTIVSLTSVTASAQTSQSNCMLHITSGNVSNIENLNPVYEKPRLEPLQIFQSIEITRPGENEGVGNTCGSETLTQSSAPEFIGNQSVWCGNNTINAETSLARGFIAPFDLTLECVTFGIRENSGGEALVHVRVLVGSPTSAYSDLTLISETEVVIADGEQVSLQSVDIENAQIPAGSQFIVEVNTPTRMPELGGDGGLLTFGTNSLGQSNPTYFRGPGCGVEDFADVESVGFGDRHLVMSLGIESGITTSLAGGFEMTLLGDAVMSTHGDNVVIAGSQAQGAFGVDIAYGDFTRGVGASFLVESVPGEFGELSIGYRCPQVSREFTFSEYQGDSSQAILTLDSGDLGDELFDVHLYNDGELVGILEDQSSGSVIMNATEPPRGATCYLDRLGSQYFTRYVFEWEDQLQCLPEVQGDHCLHFDSIGVGFSNTNPFLSGGATNLALTTSNASSLTVNSGESSPVVLFGEADSNPQHFSELGVSTQVGVPVRMTKGGLVDAIAKDNNLYATDTNSDGVAELQAFTPPEAGDTDDVISVELLLGGVDSATVGIQAMSTPVPDVTCMLVCPTFGVYFDGVRVDTVEICGATDPWISAFGPLVGNLPNFDDVGNSTYTLELYDDQTLVHSQDGMNGIAGGTVVLPIRMGTVQNDDTFGLSTIYPAATTFTTPDGQEFVIDEVRTLIEGFEGEVLLETMKITTSGMGGMTLIDPITVLPSSHVCQADLNGDGTLDFFDISSFLIAFSAMDPIADLNQNGVFDFFDVSEFLTVFAAGCP